MAYAAHQLQRPVKWVADRGEEFLGSAHGRDIEARAALALDAQGKILALRVHSLANVGAYPTMTGIAIQVLIGPWVQTSVYDIPLIDYHFTAVMTNTASTGAYRGAEKPQYISLVVIDDPKTDGGWGDTVAGPLFNQVADYCRNLYL